MDLKALLSESKRIPALFALLCLWTAAPAAESWRDLLLSRFACSKFGLYSSQLQIVQRETQSHRSNHNRGPLPPAMLGDSMLLTFQLANHEDFAAVSQM